MKTIRLLLLVMLTLLGVNTANAERVPDPNPTDNRLTSISNGDEFFLRLEYKNASGENFTNGYRWITLRTPYTAGNERLQVVENNGSVMVEAGLFSVEEIPDVELQTESGDATYQAYYLKNVETGMYVCEEERDGNSCFLKLTTEPSEALEWAFRPVSEVITDNPLLVDRFYIYTVTENGLRYLNGGSWTHNGIQAVYYGTWMDACTWFDLIPPFEKEEDLEETHIRLYTQAMAYGSVDSQGHYFVYGGIGGYEEELANEYNELMYNNTDALRMLESKGETVDWAGIVARLEALLIRMETAEVQYPEEGYFYIINGRLDWEDQSEWRAAYTQNNLGYWSTLEGNERVPAYVWHITKKDDGTFRIQNLGEGLLLTECGGQSQQYNLSVHEDRGCWLVPVGQGRFNIRAGANENAYNMHPKEHGGGTGTSGALIGWPNENPNSSMWRIIPVDEDIYAPYVEEMNRKLEEAKGESNFPPKDGYYRIISAYEQWAEEGHHRAVFAEGDIVYWRKYTAEYEDKPEYIWRFAQNADGTYRIQNLKEGLFFTDNARSGTGRLTTNEDFGAVITDLGMGEVNISISATGSSDNFIHPKGHDNGNGEYGTICGYPGGLHSQSAWKLIPAREEEYAPYVDAMEQRLEIVKRFKPVQEELNALIKEIGDNNKSAFVAELPTDAVDVTPTNYTDFWSNAAMLGGAETEEEQTHTISYGTDGQGYAALIDDNIDTYLHTYYGGDALSRITWSAYNLDGTPAEGATQTTLHNLAMKLSKPVTNVTFQLCARNSVYYNNPIKIDIEVSEDGIHWNTIFYGYDFYKTNSSAANPYLVGPFDLGGSYQYVRFANYDNDRSHSGHFFVISELKAFEGGQLTSNCQAATMPQEVVQNFLQAYSEGHLYINTTNYDLFNEMLTAKENLEAAYAAFKDNFANPDKLFIATLEAGTLIDNYVEGDNILGQYDGSVGTSDLEQYIQDGIELTATGNYTKADLDEAEKKIRDEMARIEATRVLPDPTKWYQLVYPSLQEYEENDWDKSQPEHNVVEGDMSLALYSRVAAIMNGNDSSPYENAEDLRENAGLRIYSVNEDLISDNPEVSYFRLVPVGEGKYALQNKASGLYINNLTQGSQIILSSTPGLFTLNFVGKGCTLLFSYDYWTGEASGQSIHFAWNGGNAVMGWTDNAIGTKSSIHVREADNEGDATQYFSAMAGAAQSLVRLNNIKELDGADAYIPTGMYVEYLDNDEPVYYVGLKMLEEGEGSLIEAGHPFIVVPTADTFTALVGTELTQEALSEHALCGTFKAKAMETGTGFLRYNEEQGGNYLQVVGGAIQHNASAFSSYLKIASPDDLPETEFSDEFDMLLLVRGTLVDTAIRRLDNGEKTKANDQFVYDLAGRRIATKKDIMSLKPGIYVINGRKVLVS